MIRTVRWLLLMILFCQNCTPDAGGFQPGTADQRGDSQVDVSPPDQQETDAPLEETLPPEDLRRDQDATEVLEVLSPTLTLEISPEAAQIVVGKQLQFSVQLQFRPESAATDVPLVWSVTSDVATQDPLGTISDQGLYTAPSAVPAPPEVMVTVEAPDWPGVRSSAAVTIVDAPAPTLVVGPRPEVVAVGVRIPFSATVTGLSNTAVDWMVNEQEGGSKETGFIDADGVYSSPPNLNNVPSTVTVEARSLANPSLRDQTSFRLAALFAEPTEIRGTQPGAETTLAVTATLSDGSTADVSALDTTHLLSLNPAIATTGAGSVVALGDEAGIDVVRVSDTRFFPAATTFVKVVNVPDYSMEVEPDSLVHVIKGSRSPFHVFVIPDRGPEKGDRLDVTFSSTLVVLPLDPRGRVHRPDQPNLDAPHLWTAEIDLDSGEIRLGGLPGEARFEVTESNTGASAEFSVRLADIQIIADSYKQGPPPWPVPVSPPSVLPNHRGLPVIARFVEPTNYLTYAERVRFLEGMPVLFQSSDPLARFDSRLWIYPEGCNDDNLNYNAMTAGWARAQAYTQDAFYDGAVQIPVMHYDLVWNTCFVAGLGPPHFLFSVASYFPTSRGPQSVTMSLPQLSEHPDLLPPQAVVSVEGYLPQVAILPVHTNQTTTHPDGTTTYLSYNPGTLFVDIQAVHSAPYTQAFQGIIHYQFRLKGTAPDGQEIHPDDIHVVFAGEYLARFQVRALQPGVYVFWVESDSYPQDLLEGTTSVTVVYQSGLTDILEIETPTMAGFYSPEPIVLRYRLKFPNGTPVSAIVASNNNCIDQRSWPRQEQSHLSFSMGAVATSPGGESIATRCSTGMGSQVEAVRYTLISGQSLVENSEVKWYPPVGGSTLEVAVEIVGVANGCNLSTYPGLYFSPPGEVFVGIDDCSYSPPGGRSAGMSLSQGVVHALRYTSVYPDVLFLTTPAGGEADPTTVEVEFRGDMVTQVLQGDSPIDPGDFELFPAWGEAPSGLTIQSVEAVGESAVRIVMTVMDPGNMQMASYYTLRWNIGSMIMEDGFQLARIQVVGMTALDPLLPIPLNARPKGGLPQGSTMFHLKATEIDGTQYYGLDTWTWVQVSSPFDTEEFRLAGFQRTHLPYNIMGGDETVVRQHRIAVRIQLGMDLSSPIVLLGNLTDRRADWAPAHVPMADQLPDVTSQVPDDIVLYLGNAATQQLTPLARTTAYNFVPRRPSAQLRTGPVRLQSIQSTQTMSQHWTWHELSDPPEEKCAPLTHLAAADPARDVFLQVDSSLGSDLVGLADMAFLKIGDQPVSPDGRVQGYVGESPLGRPSFPDSPSSDYQWFGVHLDGICFDPGFGLDVPPNSPALLDFAGGIGYAVPTTTQNLIPGEGGTSGGQFRPSDGAFAVVARTPGVDFPGLDCGYLAEGTPESLGVDDYEDAAVTTWLDVGMSLDPDLAPHPRRVFTFGEQKDSKNRIMTGVQTRGDNSAFLVTTQPLALDGSPLVTTKIRASFVIGEWPPSSFPEEGMNLTVRTDAAAVVYTKALKWAVPILIAACTGAIGAVIEHERILANVVINMVVATAFTGADSFFEVSLGNEAGSVAATSSGKAIGKALPKMAKILKYVFRATQGATQAITRQALSTPKARVGWAASAGSFTQDVLGGIFAGYVVDKLNPLILNESTIGAASAFAVDQLWVTLPESSLVSPAGPGPKTFTVSDIAMKELAPPTFDPKRQGDLSIEENDRSHAYLQRSGAATKPLILAVVPGGEGPEPDDPECGINAGEPVGAAEFRIQVGGIFPTVIPFVRTSLVGVQRNTEEATARVRIDRRDTSIKMTLTDIELK